jgi:pimeloyl-ACP methyl ester carboxylesterase
VTSDRRFYRMVTNHLITPVNQPTGPFPAGMTSRLVTDPTRRNRYGVSTNGSFMITIWYPAVGEAGELPGRYQDLPLAQDVTFWGSAWVADPAACFVSCALPDARCAAAQAPYPIVIYSHGWGDVRFEVAGRAPHLASYGYVVVAIDHFDAFGSVFPDGTYLHGDGSTATLAGTQDRIRDVQVVLDELSRWNDGDPILASRLDLDHIATMGFSWGAESAGEAARTDARCKAAILLDEGFSFVPDLVRLGLQKPLLLINAQYGDESLALRNSQDAISFWISSIVHLELTDYCWITDPSDLRNGREAARTLNDYSLWFLNKYLKGINDPIPPPSNYRLISNFKQK